MTFFPITRKLLFDTRWSLLFSCLAFYGLAIFHDRGVSRFQFPELYETEDRDRGPREPGTETQQANPGEQPRAEGSESGEAPPGQATPDSRSRTDATTSTAEPPQTSTASSEGSQAGDQRPESSRRGRRGPAQFYVFFGVPADLMFNSDEPPTLAMMTTFANFPLITLALIGWGIARGSAAVAGEIERGALDLTLSRPVYRSTWLAAQIVSTFIVFLVLALAMIAAHMTAQYLYPFKNAPGLTAFLPSILMVVGFGMATYAYTLAFSAGDLSRVRVGILGLGITLGGIAGLFFARQYDDYPWLERISVYHYYWPVGIVVNWTDEINQNLASLYGTFLVGTLIAFAIFTRRDLPTSGG